MTACDGVLVRLRDYLKIPAFVVQIGGSAAHKYANRTIASADLLSVTNNLKADLTLELLTAAADQTECMH